MYLVFNSSDFEFSIALISTIAISKSSDDSMGSFGFSRCDLLDKKSKLLNMDGLSATKIDQPITTVDKNKAPTKNLVS